MVDVAVGITIYQYLHTNFVTLSTARCSSSELTKPFFQAKVGHSRLLLGIAPWWPNSPHCHCWRAMPAAPAQTQASTTSLTLRLNQAGTLTTSGRPEATSTSAPAYPPVVRCHENSRVPPKHSFSVRTLCGHISNTQHMRAACLS